jgi:small-conductance mechanosensitive channel
MASVVAVVLQGTATPTPGLGPDELAVYWPDLIRGGWFLVGFGVTILLGWFVIEPLVSRVVSRRNRGNATLEEAISRYVRVLVVLIAFFVGAGVAGYGRFLANSALVIAAGTLAIGVAAQSVIGSLVSGIVLVFDPEFNVGNYIQWADGEGTVESITLRVTRVLSPNGELVTIPNTVLTSQAITRPYGRGRYRVVEHIGIAYEDDVDAAIEQLTAAAIEVQSVLDTPAPSAYVDEFASDAVVVRVHYWIEDPRRQDLFRIRSEYARAVKRRLDDAGISISPPSKRELLGRIDLDQSR